MSFEQGDNKLIYFYGHKNIYSLLRWIFKDQLKRFKLRQFDMKQGSQKPFNADEIPDFLILDVSVLKKNTLKYIQELLNIKPSVKIILIVSSITKSEVIEIIRADVVIGIILQPFTGETIYQYLNKLP